MSEIKMGNGKGMFMPEITVEMFRNASLEAVEELINSGEVFDIDLKEELHREREQAYYNGFEAGYPKGYNDAKRQIAESGEYDRIYQRGFEDGRKSEWTAIAESEE